MHFGPLRLWRYGAHVSRNFSSHNPKSYKQTCTDLRKVPKSEIQQIFKCIEAILFDADGVLWLSHHAVKGSVEAFNCFRSFGIKTLICTNNSSRTRHEIAAKAHRLGYNVKEDELLSTTYATAAYLKKINFNKRVYIIGQEGLAAELDAVGIKHTPIGPDHMKMPFPEYIKQPIQLEKDIGAVVVAFDEYFSYPKMAKAVLYLQNPECLFIATNMDEQYPLPDMILPGTGCMVHPIELCVERSPLVIGKPNAAFCADLIEEGRIKPETTLMVGDRGSTDILLGYNCGFQTLLVGSGTNSLKDVQKWRTSQNPELRKCVPDFYLPKVGDLLHILQQ